MQTVVDEGVCRPILIGRPEVMVDNIERFGLRLRPELDFEMVNPDADPRYEQLWTHYHSLMERKGVSVDYARREVRRRATLFGSLLVKFGYADGMICGVTGRFAHHLRQVDEVIGKASGCSTLATMNHLVLPNRAVFVCDTHVNENPSAEQLAEIAVMASDVVRRFGIEPKVAMLSHSNFGASSSESARKMAHATALFHALAPETEADGEMHGDGALSEDIRHKFDPESPLSGEANILVMPNLDAANISYSLLKMVAGNGVTIGPILLGAARPVQVLTTTATVRRIVNMTALTVIDAASR